MSGFPTLDVATIAYETPWSIDAQIRLLRAHLTDAYVLTVFDNSVDPDLADEIEQLSLETETRYVRIGPPGASREHALNLAARDLDARALPHCAFLDHDVFPRRRTSLVELVEPAGFFGLQRRHRPTGDAYLWPGLACFSRTWLRERKLDFRRIQGPIDEIQGDAGSMLHVLFDESDWDRAPEPEHVYKPVRDLDEAGVESWAVELIGDWLHAMNITRHRPVPDPDGRLQLVRELVEGLG